MDKSFQKRIEEAAEKYENKCFYDLGITEAFEAGASFVASYSKPIIQVLQKDINSHKEKFPNGVVSYLETFYEVVAEITQSINVGYLSKRVTDIQINKGTGGLYELAEELTDKFEKLHANTEFGINTFEDYIDVVDEFLKKELYEY